MTEQMNSNSSSCCERKMMLRKMICLTWVCGSCCCLLLMGVVFNRKDGSDTSVNPKVKMIPSMIPESDSRFGRGHMTKANLSSSSSPLSSSLLLSSSSSSSSEKRQLLLVTKGRSGSSFTSALINNDRQVFYTFEPLYDIDRLRNLSHDDNFLRQKAYSLLKAFLECDFSELLGLDLLWNNQIKNSGPLAKNFSDCIRTWAYGSHHLTCLFKYVRACKTKAVTFAKVIRFPMIWAEPVLRKLPSLKILYLIRDPRAVLRSQSSVFHNFQWPEELESASKLHCADVDADIAEIERLQVLFPGRIRVIKYERGAIESMEYAKDIYKFVGLNFTQQTKEYHDYLKTPATTRFYYSFNIHRNNGTEIVNQWRNGSQYDTIKPVDEVCANVYNKMGYKSVTSQSDLDSNRELFELDVPFNRLLTL